MMGYVSTSNIVRPFHLFFILTNTTIFPKTRAVLTFIDMSKDSVNVDIGLQQPLLAQERSRVDDGRVV